MKLENTIDERIGKTSGLPKYVGPTGSWTTNKQTGFGVSVLAYDQLLAYSILMTNDDPEFWMNIGTNDVSVKEYGDDWESYVSLGHLIGCIGNVALGLESEKGTGDIQFRLLVGENPTIDDIQLYKDRGPKNSIDENKELTSKVLQSLTATELKIMGIAKRLKVDPELQEMFREVYRAGSSFHIYNKTIEIFDYVTRDDMNPYYRRVMLHSYLSQILVLIAMANEATGITYEPGKLFNMADKRSYDSVVSPTDKINNVIVWRGAFWKILEENPVYAENKAKIIYFLSGFNPVDELDPEFEKVIISFTRTLLSITFWSCFGSMYSMRFMKTISDYGFCVFQKIYDLRSVDTFTEAIPVVLESTPEFIRDKVRMVINQSVSAIGCAVFGDSNDLTDLIMKDNYDLVKKCIMNTKTDDWFDEDAKAEDKVHPLYSFIDPILKYFNVDWTYRIHRVESLYDFCDLMTEIATVMIRKVGPTEGKFRYVNRISSLYIETFIVTLIQLNDGNDMAHAIAEISNVWETWSDIYEGYSVERDERMKEYVRKRVFGNNSDDMNPIEALLIMLEKVGDIVDEAADFDYEIDDYLGETEMRELNQSVNNFLPELIAFKNLFAVIDF